MKGIAIPLLFALAMLSAAPAAPRIRIVPDDFARRVDVLIDGQPFTSYVYPTTLKKPALYPLRTAKGTVVTRGFPLEPRPGERTDHPHHAGLWFSHGDVNGLDFWNNSDAIPADQAPKMGTTVHRRIVEGISADDRGELIVEMDWINHEGAVLLYEQARFVFRGDRDFRSIDRFTRLTALKEAVTLRDSKESTLGMRVARELEQPESEPPGEGGRESPADKSGVTGRYVNSEGLEGDAVWGSRARWAMLRGRIASEPVTVAILDHPSNPNFPTHWHARGYGLFAANPLAARAFSDKEAPVAITIEPGASIQFRHRILILDRAAAPIDIEREYARFTERR